MEEIISELVEISVETIQYKEKTINMTLGACGSIQKNSNICIIAVLETEDTEKGEHTIFEEMAA